jgi:hypothetical protein
MRLLYPTADASAVRLKRHGWSTAETSVSDSPGLVWVVMASRQGRQLFARGATRAEAWHRACPRAEALGAGEW